MCEKNAFDTYFYFLALFLHKESPSKVCKLVSYSFLLPCNRRDYMFLRQVWIYHLWVERPSPVPI